MYWFIPRDELYSTDFDKIQDRFMLLFFFEMFFKELHKNREDFPFLFPRHLWDDFFKTFNYAVLRSASNLTFKSKFQYFKKLVYHREGYNLIYPHFVKIQKIMNREISIGIDYWMHIMKLYYNGILFRKDMSEDEKLKELIKYVKQGERKDFFWVYEHSMTMDLDGLINYVYSGKIFLWLSELIDHKDPDKIDYQTYINEFNEKYKFERPDVIRILPYTIHEKDDDELNIRLR